jgi:DHA2 family multidrug resistance protein
MTPRTSATPHPRLLYATILLLSLTEFLQSGMTAFAAAPIMGELGMGPEQFSLVAAVYASVAIVTISMHRWVVEHIGGRRFVQACAALTLAGAVLCASSHSFAGFIAGRVVMAIGGGSFFTACRMLVHHELAGPQRFNGIRCIATGLAVGIAAAPWLAATAVSGGNWSAIYWGVAALAGVIVLLAGVAVPKARPHNDAPAKMKVWPQLLLFAASFGLLYALQRFCYDFYGDVLPLALICAVAILGLLLYLALQYRAGRPMLRVREMLNARYGLGLALFFFAYLMLGANNVVVPAMLMGSLGLAWESVGHVEAIGLCAALLTFIVLARLQPRSPAPRKYLATGFAALTLFGVLLARIDSGANAWAHVLPALALNSIFLLTVLPVTAMHTFRAVEHDEALFSNAQQLKNMMAQAGIAVGITLATIGQQWRTAVHYTTLAESLNAYNPTFEATLLQLQQAFEGTLGPTEAAGAALARVAQITTQQAAMLANIDHFSAIAVLGVTGIAVIWRQRVFR